MQIPPLQSLLHHRCLQVAERPRRNLPDGGLTASEPSGIVLGRKISDQRCNSMLRLQLSQRLLQESSLARSRARDEAHNEHSSCAELLTESARDHVVLLQNVAAHLNQPRLAHCCTSSAKTSSSFPCSTSPAGDPQTGQVNNCTLPSTRFSLHCGQNTATGTSSISSRDPSSGVSWHAISYEKSNASFTTPDSAPSRRWTALT